MRIAMVKPIITLVLCACFGLLGAAELGVKNLQESSPDQYTVVKGDTLWAISGRFLKEPWRWPEVWDMNKDQIKNPHLIYPGDLIVLDKTAGKPRLRLVKKHTLKETVKLSPTVRSESLAEKAVPSIPPSAIEPFLSQPLVADENALSGAPQIVATQESRVALGAGNTAYVHGLRDQKTRHWQVFRPGKPLIDPDTNEVLGHEARYLGDVKVIEFGDVSTVEVTKSVQEILRGDRLLPAPPPDFISYVPHAPASPVNGRVIASYGGVAEVGQHAIIALNRGSRDGLEIGHVLTLLRSGATVKTSGDGYSRMQYGKSDDPDAVRLPDERYGLVFVFRTFDRVSYALVMETNRPVQMFDKVKTP